MAELETRSETRPHHARIGVVWSARDDANTAAIAQYQAIETDSTRFVLFFFKWASGDMTGNWDDRLTRTPWWNWRVYWHQRAANCMSTSFEMKEQYSHPRGRRQKGPGREDDRNVDVSHFLDHIRVADKNEDMQWLFHLMGAARSDGCDLV